MVCHHPFAVHAGKHKTRSFIRSIGRQLSTKCNMLPVDTKNRSGLETTGPGPIHGRPVVTAKPSFQNIFDGNGKFIACLGVLVCTLAEHCISAAGTESSYTKLLGFNNRSHS